MRLGHLLAACRSRKSKLVTMEATEVAAAATVVAVAATVEVDMAEAMAEVVVAMVADTNSSSSSKATEPPPTRPFETIRAEHIDKNESAAGLPPVGATNLGMAANASMNHILNYIPL